MVRDFRHATRSLIRNPASSSVLVATLAVGLAGSGAAFSVLDAALFQAVPAESPDRLMSVSEINLETGLAFDASPANFADWRDASNSFSAMVLLSLSEYTIDSGGAYPERVNGMLVSQDFFKAFGRSAFKGRVLLSEDFEAAAAAIVVTHSFWKTRLGGAEVLEDLRVSLDGSSHQVVGVMPRDFNFTRLPGSAERAEFWLPRDLKRELRGFRRSARRYPVIARLRPGVSLERAESELVAVAQSLAERYPDVNRGFRIRLKPLQEVMAEGSRTALLLLFGAFAFFWLVCVVNVANLMLSKSIAREDEMAVRSALGATRLSLLRLHLMEALLVSLAAALAAAALAPWALRAMTLFNVGAWPEFAEARPDGRTFLFLGLLALLSSLLGAALAVVRSWKRFPDRNALVARGPSGSRSRGRLAAALVVCEVALATVLCAGAGLMLKTFFELSRVDVGFQAQRVLAFGLSIPAVDHPLHTRVALLRRVLEELESLPGVETAAAGQHPLSHAVDFPVSGESGAEPVPAKLLPVSPDYFEVLGIPLLEGRGFEAGDREDSLLVAVASQSLAQRLWPNESPIGKRIRLSDQDEPLRRIVGVVGGVRRAGPENSSSSDLYLPLGQPSKVIPANLLVRSDAKGRRELPQAVRRATASLDDRIAVQDMAWLEDTLVDTWKEKRTMGYLLTCLAALSLGLALLGLYSVMSSHVNRRRPEIGIRMALGAGPSLIFRWVLLTGSKMLLIGLGAGLLLSLLLSRVLSGFLFRVSPFDPLSLALVAASVSLGALAACALPGQRAAAVDPMRVLRRE